MNHIPSNDTNTNIVSLTRIQCSISKHSLTHSPISLYTRILRNTKLALRARTQVQEEAGETIPDELKPAMPGQEQNEDTGGNGAGSGSNADGTGTNPDYSIKQGSELYGPPSCHESASIPFDDGKGVLVFGGLSYEFTTSNVGDSVYNNDAWYLRVGWENSKQDLKRSGYMWNPAVIQGSSMSPRAGHTGTWCSYNSLSQCFHQTVNVFTSYHLYHSFISEEVNCIICITHLYQKKITRTRNARMHTQMRFPNINTRTQVL